MVNNYREALGNMKVSTILEKGDESWSFFNRLNNMPNQE